MQNAGEDLRHLLTYISGISGVTCLAGAVVTGWLRIWMYRSEHLDQIKLKDDVIAIERAEKVRLQLALEKSEKLREAATDKLFALAERMAERLAA